MIMKFAKQIGEPNGNALAKSDKMFGETKEKWKTKCK